MTRLVFPETYATPDWPRKVKQVVDQIERRVSALEIAPAQGFEVLAAAPGTPFEGQSYYDNVLKKVRTWDGAAWNDHW